MWFERGKRNKKKSIVFSRSKRRATNRPLRTVGKLFRASCFFWLGVCTKCFPTLLRIHMWLFFFCSAASHHLPWKLRRNRRGPKNQQHQEISTIAKVGKLSESSNVEPSVPEGEGERPDKMEKDEDGQIGSLRETIPPSPLLFLVRTSENATDYSLPRLLPNFKYKNRHHLPQPKLLEGRIF